MSGVTFTGNGAIGGAGNVGAALGQGKGGGVFIFSGATTTFGNVSFAGSVAADAGKAGIGSSPTPYTNGAKCPGSDNVDVCGSYNSVASTDATQTVLPGSAFNDLQVTAGINGSPAVDGTQVTFTAPGSGPSGLFSNGQTSITVTTSGGKVSVPFTANGITGSYKVTAAVSGGATETFTLTNQCQTSVPVTNTNDAGTGSLRASVAGTCAGGTVDLSGFSDGTKFPLQSRLYLFQDLTIKGPAAGTVTIDGGQATRLFFLQSGKVAISSLTLANGHGKGGNGGGGGAGMGGAIFQNNGELALTNVVLKGNQALGGDGGFQWGGGGFGGDGTLTAGGSGGDLSDGGGAKDGSVAGFGGGGSYGPLSGHGGFGGGGGNYGGKGGWSGGTGVTSAGAGGGGLGGAIFQRSGTLTLISVSFVSNGVFGASYGQGKGGALFVYAGANATLTNVTFSGSVAADAGKAGSGDSASSYVNGAQCPGEDSVDVCGVTNNNVTISASVAGLSYGIDNLGTFTTPQTETWASGSAHTLTTTSPQNGYAFNGWSDGRATTTDAVTASRTVTSYVANFGVATVQVTVGTSPSGLSYSVDGVPYSSAHQFTWNAGDGHTIATTSPQAGSAGTQYAFTGWSDSGALSHVVTVAANVTTYTASFKTQYLLTTAANPTAGGTVSAGGYFDANSTPAVIATANASYQFSGWTGNVTNAANASTTAVMTAPQTVTANFGGSAGFVTGQTPGPLRNNYSGFVGMEFTVGSTPTAAYTLGRFVVAGNTQTHVVKLVQANGVDVPNGSVTVATAGATAGTFQYAALANPVTLAANTSYFLVSQETAGGDQWYEYGAVTVAPVGSVVGPAYTDAFGHYVPLTTLPGQSYVPVNFQFAPPTTALSVNITSPAANASISGTASVSVSTTGPVTSLQVQIDGVNQGSAIPVSVNQGPAYTLQFDTTVLSIGSHALTVIANGSVVSAPVTVNVNNSPGGSTAFVVGQTPGPVRNNYTGFVGMTLRTGSTPVVVASLGRFAVAGNAGTHLVKLVNADGTDVPGGSVAISMAGSTAGTFQYAGLPAGPFTLQANTTYYLVSQETAGGDQWYDYGSVATSAVASVVGPTYTDGGGHYVTVGGLGGQSYVPVSFLYGPTANTLSATISSPQNGALLSGVVPVNVSVTGTVTSYQLVVDGNTAGGPASSAPLSFDSAGVSNGQHKLAVRVAGNGATAVSPGVTVTVNNVAGALTAFTTGQSPRPLRNNYSGNVGMTIQVGAAPVAVVSLGRYVVSGNSGTHVLKLVQANGTDVAGGSVTLSVAGAAAGQYMYAALPGTVTLTANTTYYLVSQETAGGDMWYDLEPITTTGVATVAGPTYTDGGGHYVTVGGFAGYSYVPLSFQYQ